MVSQLQMILTVYQADITSWLELGEIYISLSDYQACISSYNNLYLKAYPVVHSHDCRLNAYCYELCYELS